MRRSLPIFNNVLIIVRNPLGSLLVTHHELVKTGCRAATPRVVSSIISIIRKIFESSFLINLFEDTKVVHIFYKSSQTYDTNINGDK
jgi:hypothetical protein